MTKKHIFTSHNAVGTCPEVSSVFPAWAFILSRQQGETNEDCRKGALGIILAWVTKIEKML